MSFNFKSHFLNSFIHSIACLGKAFFAEMLKTVSRVSEYPRYIFTVSQTVYFLFEFYQFRRAPTGFYLYLLARHETF